MRRGIIKFATIVVMLAVCGIAEAATPDLRKRRSDIEELLERNRWGEARMSLEAMRSDLDPIKDKHELEWLDYHYVRCAMELDFADAEAMMLQYMERYPASMYTNQMQFLLGSYYCDRSNLADSEVELMKVDYKGLDARQRERYDVRMGYIRFVQGDFDTAEAHFERIAKHSDYYNHALYYLSYIHYQRGEYMVAKEGFTLLCNQEPYRNLAPFYLLQIEYRNNNHDYVIEHGEELLGLATCNAKDDLMRIIAESYFHNGDYVNAYRYISAYPAEKRDRQEHYIMGYSLYRQALYHKALEPLGKVCGGEDDALSQNASYHLGDCYLRCGDKANAARAFGIASKSECDITIAEDALLNYGRLTFELGGGVFNESINVLQSYLKRYPKSLHAEEVKSLLIAAYYNSKDYDAAYIAIKEFDNPDNEIRAALQKVATLRAVKAVERGDYNMAEVLLLEAEQIGLNAKYNALVQYWLGEVSYAKGDMAAAKQRYESYVRRAPKSEKEYSFANYGIGYCNFAQNDMKAAAEAFEDFVRDYTVRDGYMYDGHNRLGDARYALRDFAAARRAYNISSSSSITSARGYARYQLAMVDGIENKTRSKIERLKGIVSDGDSDYVDDAWYELGRTYIGAERYVDGAATLQEFVDSDTQSSYYIPAMSDLGLAYFNLGRKDDALRCYEEVVAYDPLSSAAMEAMRGIREIYVAKGDIDAYFDYAARCGVQSDMSVAARDSLSFASAKSAYLDGDMDAAGTKLKNYLETFVNGYNRTEALFYLSDYYVMSENDDAAIETMTELLSHGETQYTERVLRVLAPMSFDKQRYDLSAESYRKLYDVASTDELRGRASEGYVDATLLYADGAKIKSMADDVAKMSSATNRAQRQAKLAKANILTKEGDKESANKLYMELAKNRKSEEGAEAYYHLIAAKYEAGDYAAAEQMVYDFGAGGSMYWQAKSFILLGDILVKMDNTFQARATYQSIVDGYSPRNDGIIDEAQQRIKALK